jgi:ClpP class serine protease
MVLADAKPTLFSRLAGFARLIFWLLLIWLVVSQFLGSGRLQATRAEAFARFEQERGSKVIAMIHRQEGASILGVPVGASIGIDDSEAILRAIRLTPDETPIDLILHTPGGLVLAAEQIARALGNRKGKVTVFVPHYAMSGGTLIAMAADEIVMDKFAVLGPVDPQIGSAPAASIIKAVEQKPVERVSDETLVLADISRKARAQVEAFVLSLLDKHGLSKEKAIATAKTLSEGRFTHDYPIPPDAVRELGLKVSTEMPRIVYDIMDLYPQSQGRRPSVLYIEPPRMPRGDGGQGGEAPASPRR